MNILSAKKIVRSVRHPSKSFKALLRLKDASLAAKKTSYSQSSEEKYILKGVGKKTGKFLDIGAWDPKVFSNTRALYERGWSGVMIEPSPWPFQNLLEEYGNVDHISLVCAAVGLKRGLVEFFATADAVSTWDIQWRKRWEKDGVKYRRFFVQVITIEEIIKKFGKNFQFINIDTEKSSADLAIHMLKLGIRPDCFCVEHDGRSDEIENKAKAFGYKKLLVNGENLIMALK